MPDDRLRHVAEAPAGDPRPQVEIDVLVEGEIALVIAPEPGEEFAAQQAGGATDAEDLVRPQRRWRLRLPRPLLESAAIAAQRLAGAVEKGAPLGIRRFDVSLQLQDPRLHPAEARVGVERGNQWQQAAGGQRRVGVEDQDRVGAGTADAEVDGGGEADVAGQRQMRHALAFEIGERAVAGAVVDHEQLQLQRLRSERFQAAGKQPQRVPAGDDHGDGSGLTHVAQA